MKKFSTLLILLSVFTLLFFSCKNDGENTTSTKDSTNVVTDEKNNSDVKTFYLVPSPEDVFGFANDKNLKFDKDLLNPVENLDKYNDTKLQEINFGVYSADLAYCAASNKNDETVQYLNVVREISQDIGLAEVFNESLIYRIEHVTPEKDSLIALSNDTYFDIMRYLEKNDRENTLAIMAAGGWLECMYLVVMQTDYSDDNPTIQKVADQKLIFSNLWKFLEQNSDDPNIKSIMDDFSDINDLFNELEVVVDENDNTKTENNEKIIIVGGNNRVVINKEQYDILKKYIIETRNKLTLNNVTF